MKIHGVNIPGREKKLCESIRPEQGWPVRNCKKALGWGLRSEDNRGTR